MAFRIGVHADMALIQVRHHGVRQRAGMFRIVDVFWIDRLFAHQNGDAGALWFIILARDIQHVGTDDRAGFRQDLGQTSGVVLLIDIGDIAIAFGFSIRITNIVNTKTQAFGQVVEAMQFKLLQFGSPPYKGRSAGTAAARNYRHGSLDCSSGTAGQLQRNAPAAWRERADAAPDYRSPRRRS